MWRCRFEPRCYSHLSLNKMSICCTIKENQVITASNPQPLHKVKRVLWYLRENYNPRSINFNSKTCVICRGTYARQNGCFRDGKCLIIKISSVIKFSFRERIFPKYFSRNFLISSGFGRSFPCSDFLHIKMLKVDHPLAAAQGAHAPHNNTWGIDFSSVHFLAVQMAFAPLGFRQV